MNQQYPVPKDMLHPRQKYRLVIAGLVLLLLVGALWPIAQKAWWVSDRPDSLDKHRDSSVFSLNTSQKFQYMRQVDMLGHQFVMMKHLPTSQRMVILTGAPEQGEVYHGIYQQQFSVLEFSIIMQLFKQGTEHFQNAKIQVTEVQLERQGQFNNKNQDFVIPFKRYAIHTKVNNHLETYEAYVAEILEKKHPKGLLFTFNAQGYTSTAPFYNLLDELKPSQSLSAKVARRS